MEKIKLKKFTIRPRIKESESLISYLMRVSLENQISIFELLQYISKSNQRTHPRCFHYYDINPTRVINPAKLHSLNLDMRSISKLSFLSVLEKFNLNIQCTQSINTFFNDSIVRKKRRFCPKCLLSDVYYPLFWQIKNIEYCTKHKINLTSICYNCGNDQPYFHELLVFGNCIFCNKSLYSNDFIKPIKNEVNSSWYLSQWEHILDTQVKNTNNNKELIYKFLYLCCNKINYFNVKEVNYINRDYKYKIINFLKDKEQNTKDFCININVLLKILEIYNLSFFDFFHFTLPASFRQSIEIYIEKNEHIMCLSPWCKSYYKVLGLIKTNIVSSTHTNIHVCKFCSVRFGKNKTTKTWEEHGDIIEVAWSKVLPLLNLGYSKLHTSNKLNISRYKVNKLTAYLSRHNLLNDICKKTYSISYNDDTSYFINNLQKNEITSIKNSMRNNNWTINEAYYHFFDPKVQVLFSTD